MDFLLRPVSEDRALKGETRSFSLIIDGIEHDLFISADLNSRFEEFSIENGFVIAVGNFLATRGFDHQDLNDWVRSLKGQFFVCHYDETKGLTVFTDHLLSIRPYYIHTPMGYIMSSRLDLVARLARSSLTVRYENIFCYLFRFPIGWHSFFHEIDILPTASKSVLRKGGITTESWWKVQDYKGADAGILAELLVQNAVSWLEHSPTSACALTGGLDSRLMLAAFATAAEKVGQPLEAFTAGHKLTHDVYLAKSVTAKLGIRHHHLEYREEEIRKTLEHLEDADPLWMTTSGEGRHTFIYMHWMREALQQRGITCKLSGLGGEVFKGKLYRAVDRFGNAKEAVRTELTLPKAECFGIRGQEALLRTEDYFIEQSFNDAPEGLSDYQLTDWWRRRHTFSRGWASRYHSWGGALHCPLLDQEVLDCAASIPAEAMFDGALHAAVTNRLQPVISNIPVSSGSFPGVFKPTVAWRLKRLALKKVFGLSVRQANDPGAIRPYILDQWKAVARRLCENLPAFAPLVERIDDTPLFGLTQDFRMYYLMRFLDDLIHIHGVNITEPR